MRAFVVFLFLLTSSAVLRAQDNQVRLLAQSPDGRNVMLLWTMNHWPGGVTAFDIKRKDGLAEWVKLNREPITAGISMKKTFGASGLSKSEESLLKARLYKLLAGRKLKETDNSWPSKLASDEQQLKELMYLVVHDRDVALAAGFGYNDHTITKKTDYQYGLFAAGTDNLLATATWNYGEVPNLSVIADITSRATTKSSGIGVLWTADSKKMQAGEVAGFNIYREGIRLNNAPITATDAQAPMDFEWFDKNANSAEQVRYSISAESVFGIEGIIRSYTYNPAEHPKEYAATEVTDINSEGYYFKDGISVKWNFPREHERFIRGFYVEKDNMPAGYNRVSALLGPDTRSFIDKTASPVSGYVRYKIIAVYHDRTQWPGTERLYSYFPVAAPPVPQNLKIKYTVKDKNRAVHLSWDAKMNGDVTTDNYRIYVQDPTSNKYELINENHNVKSSSYVYNLPGDKAGTYKFYVSAVTRQGVESMGTDTLSVYAQGTTLPAPVIIKTEMNGNRVVIHWQYPEVPDLKGFRLFDGAGMIAGENEIRRHLRDFMTQALAPGEHLLWLRAVDENSTESDNSAGVQVSIPGAK